MIEQNIAKHIKMVKLQPDTSWIARLSSQGQKDRTSGAAALNIKTQDNIYYSFPFCAGESAEHATL